MNPAYLEYFFIRTEIGENTNMPGSKEAACRVIILLVWSPVKNEGLLKIINEDLGKKIDVSMIPQTCGDPKLKYTDSNEFRVLTWKLFQCLLEEFTKCP